MSTCLIAVHCGAGYHSERSYKNYNNLSKKACKVGIKLLKKGINALEVIKEVITVLENDPLTNCGFGSNLTFTGGVELDASIMDGKTLTFGGCGAVPKIKNPIGLAYDICVQQMEKQPLGLVAPHLLVGKGALDYAKNKGLKVVETKSLVSRKALTQYTKYKRILENLESEDQNESRQKNLLDTVGAVCIDSDGNVAAGSSSGGILLKKPGRVGQAAIYGCGTWADSFDQENEPCVAVCTSGCGEHLVQTHLAKEIGDDLKHSTCPTTSLSKSMTQKFLNSRYLRNVKEKLCGALVLYVNRQDIEVLWGHSTESMSIGIMRSSDQKPKAFISTLPKETTQGTAINISGMYFNRNKE